MALPAPEYEMQATPEHPFDVRTQEHDHSCLISVSGELDMSTAPVLQREVLKAEAGASRPIVVDLHDLTFMDCTGLHLLLAAGARSWANGHSLTVVRGPRAVQLVFELTGTDELLSFVD